MSVVYLDGKLIPEDQALIPVNDRAILFGDGAYETVRTYQGKPFRLVQHLERLAITLEGIQIDLPLDIDAIGAGLLELVQTNDHPDARVRITVTGGDHTGTIRLARNHPPRFIMTSMPLPVLPEATYRNGVQVLISDYKITHTSPLARLKTTPRLLNLMAKEEALQAGAFESIFFDEHGHVLEGTASNVFIVEKGALVTPALDLAILAGVTRDMVLSVAENLGVPSSEEAITRDRLLGADEVFVTNTTCELVPVSQIDDHRIGKPGPLWYRLAEGYRRAVELELGIKLEPLPVVQ